MPGGPDQLHAPCKEHSRTGSTPGHPTMHGVTGGWFSLTLREDLGAGRRVEADFKAVEEGVSVCPLRIL